MPTPDKLKQVAKELVQEGKFLPKNGQTYCNFFLREFGKRLLGTDLSELQGRAAHQTDNLAAASNWATLGFRTATTNEAKQAVFDEAQQLANAGVFVVAGGKAPKASKAYSGHVAVVVPSRETNGALAAKSGSWGLRCPFIAHAGNKVFDYKGLNFGFGSKYKGDRLELFAMTKTSPAPVPDPTEFLGDFDLRRGDKDAKKIWGGQIRPLSDGLDYVTTLQQLLIELGFLIVKGHAGTAGADGDFGRLTEWAVREFQLYAKATGGTVLTDASADLPHKRYSAVDVAVGDRYDGEIDGVVNARTRELLQAWQTDNRKCPVILTAFGHASNAERGDTVNAENVWGKDSFTEKVAHVHALDHSKLFQIPSEELDDEGYLIVGKYGTSAFGNGPFAIPQAGHSWDRAELLPVHLVGKETDDLSESEESTFRVVRAVAEVECLGFFDCINAYDSAFLSLGPCHWTVALTAPKGKADPGELVAYGALLRGSSDATKQNGYRDAFTRFGIQTEDEWGTNGKKLFVNYLRKYQDRAVLPRPGDDLTIRTVSEADYFRHWHSVYRFQMAGRLVDGFRLGMWDMSRLRLRDILAAPLRKDAKVDDTSGGDAATLGDVFASEKSAAILLRCHVNAPAYIVKGGSASKRMSDVIASVRASDPALVSGAPDTWTDEAEEKLIEALLVSATTKMNSPIKDTINKVANWPDDRGATLENRFALKADDPLADNLATTRDFDLDKTGLTPPPFSSEKKQAAVQLTPPILNEQDGSEIGLCGKPDSSGKIESLFLQIAVEPQQPLTGSVGDDLDNPPGPDPDPPDPEPITPTMQTIEIPLKEPVALALETDDGDPIAVELPDGSIEYFDLQVPKDLQEIDAFRVSADLSGFLGIDGIDLTAEVSIEDVTYSGQVPTGGKLLAQLKLSGHMIPREMVWTFACAGSVAAAENLRKFQIGDDELSFPFATSGSSSELPLGLDDANWTLSGNLTAGRGVQNKFRLVLDSTLGGEVAVDLGSPLAQAYAKGSFEVYLDTDELLQIRIPTDDLAAGIRLDLFQDFRGQAVINNQWESVTGIPSLDNHLIKIERSLDELYSDITLRWRLGKLEIPPTLLSYFFNEISKTTANAKRQLQSLAGKLLATASTSKVRFDACPKGLIRTNLGESSATATFEKGVPAGSHELFVTWKSGGDNAEAVPVEVRVSGRVYRGYVNQQSDPNPDQTLGGVGFEKVRFTAEFPNENPVQDPPLESFTVGPGPINEIASVVIGNSAAGKTVADAIAIGPDVLGSPKLTGDWTPIPRGGGRSGDYQTADSAEMPDNITLGLCLIATVDDGNRANDNDESKIVFQGRGEFAFNVAKYDEATGNVTFSAESFQCGSESTLTVIRKDWVHNFGELVSLSVPRNVAFKFVAKPGRNEFEYLPAQSAAAQASKIRLRIPATQNPGAAENALAKTEEKRFTFELDEFNVQSGGVDLRGRVLKEDVNLGEDTKTALKEPVNVEGLKPTADEPPKEYQVGEVAFKDSRLIFAQVRASAQISYFDDGYGVFTLTVSETGVGAWDIIAELDISGNKEFHVDALFSTVAINRFQFSTSYNTGTKDWNTGGAISGHIKFQPPSGKSSGDMGPLSDMFGKGIMVKFEDWNPLDLTSPSKFTIEVQPQEFEIAKLLGVSFRGLEITPRVGSNKAIGPFGILGDVTIKRIPGIDAELTFGGITIEPKLPIPGFSIKRIGAELTIPGSFTATGEFEHIKDEREEGFAGSFGLKTEVLPPIDGLISLTSLKTLEDGKRVPSIALYLKAGKLDIPLFAGFYMRSLGFGLGLNRGLRGLMPSPTDQRTIQQRLMGIVDNPAGLPNPSQLSSWEPAQPEKVSSPLKWMFVADSLITFGKQPEDTPHTLAGSAVLSVNYEGEVFLGVNLWLFASPEETQQAEFQVAPAARGGILLSIKERTVFGLFRTLKKPKLGEKSPQLLREVLGALETTLMFQADPNGFLLEIGWPWETKIGKTIGPLTGELTSGYRFGIYRGIVSFGLNWAIMMKLEAEKRIGFSTWIGSAEARFRVYGEGSLRISFTGALDHGLKPYLLGDVRLSATIQLSIEAECRLSKKIGFIKIRLRISFKKSLEISISAALTMALDPKPSLGARGTARVSVSVCGYRMGGNVDFEFKKEVIDTVRSKIQELLPPPLTPPTVTPFSLLAPESAALVATVPTDWNYLYRRYEHDGEKRVRVLLFPEPGVAYPSVPPPPESGNPPPRLSLKLLDGAEFVGIVSNPDGAPPSSITDSRLEWTENLSGEVISREELLSTPENYEAGDPISGETPADSITLLDLLEAISDGATQSARNSTSFGAELENVDERPWNPSPEYSDDPAAELMPEGMYSPHLRADTPYDQQVAHASGEQTAPTRPDPVDGAADGMSATMILNEMIQMMGDDVPAADAFTLAPHMRLVLEFKDPTDDELSDPVKSIIDIDDAESMRIDGNPVPLRGVYERDGQQHPTLPNYDLITGPPAQADDRVCLNWELWRVGDEPANRAKRAIDFQYAELFEYRVQRTVVGRDQRPTETRIRPAFLDATSDRTGVSDLEERQLIRPQFQFVDTDLSDVNENDLVFYHIEAWSPDRLLSRTEVYVQRQTTRVLPPVQQSLVLNELHDTDVPRLRFVALTSDEDSDGAGPNDFVATAPILRLHYRIATASSQGSYGVQQSGLGTTRWSRGVKGRPRDEQFQVQFAEPAQRRSIPWVETTDLDELNGTRVPLGTWQPIVSGQSAPFGFELVLDESQIVQRMIAHRGKELEPKESIEFFIGIDSGSEIGQPSIQRSPMVRMRHAIARKNDDGQINGEQEKQSLRSRLTRGSTVDAIERFTVPRERRFLSKYVIETEVDYGTFEKVSETPDQGEPREKPKQVNDAVLNVAWPHDNSLTGRWVPDGDELTREAFDPVVGYRIYRLDALDVHEHPLDVGSALTSRADLLVEVASEVEYRARPASIDVAGIKRTEQTIETDWNHASSGISSDVADVDSDFAYLNNGQMATESYLFAEVDRVIRGIRAELGGTIRAAYKSSAPVLPNAPKPVSGTDTLKSRFDSFASTFDWRSDPLGWRSAESLGMSCEVVFEDSSSGRAVNGEVIQAAWEKLLGEDALPGVSVTFFQADDGKTLLDVVRFTVSRQPGVRDLSGREGQGVATCDIRKYLLLQLAAVPTVDGDREPSDQEIDDAINAMTTALGSNLTDFLREVSDRLRGGQTVSDVNRASSHTFRKMRDPESISDAQRRSNVGRTSLTLPVREGELIRCRLPVPDRWAHEYKIAIEPIRRYDSARHLAAGENVIPVPKVPEDSIHESSVLRSKELVGLNVFSTPLPGAIQAGVFRHVASFASTANVEQKDRAQIGPTTIYLERNVDQLLQQIQLFDEIPTLVNKPPSDAWDLYNQWLTTQGHLKTDSSLGLTVNPSADPNVSRLHLDVPPVAQHGLYGADRYVIPDLPPNYQYRFVAQAKAGVIRSKRCETGFVSPMFDCLEDYGGAQTSDGPRMQPNAFAQPFSGGTPQYLVTSQDRVLTLKIPLVFSRYHLRPDIRPLWVDAEQPILLDEDNSAKTVGYGSLPDLFCNYRVLLLQNYDARFPSGGTPETAVLVPLFEIRPPDFSLIDGAFIPWFTLEKRPTSIDWANPRGVTAPNGDKHEFIPIEQDDRGELHFVIQIKVTAKGEPFHDALMAAMRDTRVANGLQRALYVTVTRDGKVSNLAPNDLNT